MSNINFDNPWLLLIAIPLLAAVLVPFFITVKKDNANFHNIASVCLHSLLVICITLAFSGMAFETVVTDTQVFVLADVSYSASHNLDDVQSKVEKVAGKLPKNSKMGVIVFGRDYLRASDLGEGVPNIRTASEKIDKSATDIGAVLRYAGNLFDEDVIKRIVVITDGVETVTSNNIVTVVGNLQDEGVYIDAVFIDDNITDDIKEVQVDGVDAISSVYIDKEETASVLVRVNCGKESTGKAIDSVNGYVNLYQNGTLLKRQTERFYNGLNSVTLELPTDKTGTFSYEVRVETENSDSDTNPYNNVGFFTQQIHDERKVLFIGGSYADVNAGRRIYGTQNADYVSNVAEVPLAIEDMCDYDEIVLSNFDVRTLRAYDLFLTSLESLVNDYGKTLTTYGNTYIQEDDPDSENTPLKRLSNLLPVRIGNFDQDQRLVAIVLDVSLSTNYSSRLAVAKRAAVELVSVLNNTDTVLVVGFSKVIEEFQPATQLTARRVVVQKIEEKTVENGTSLGGALKATHQMLPSRFHDKQVIIITDCVTSANDFAEANTQVKAMTEDGIVVSAISIYPDAAHGANLERIIVNNATSPDFFYKAIDSEQKVDVVFKELSQQTQQIRIDEDGVSYGVTVNNAADATVEGVNILSDVDGFWYNAAKTQATTVLTVKYWRDKITSFDVPLYAHWSGGGKGKVVSFLSDIASDWASGWFSDTDGQKFLSNIPEATLPNERITTPFLVETEGNGSTTTVSVRVPSTMLNGSTFTALLSSPDGGISEKTLAFASGVYLATFQTDAPGTYNIALSYKGDDTDYEYSVDFSIAYYAEYDSFTSYSSSYLYRVKSENGKILNLDEIKTLENTHSEYTSYMFDFTVPLMIACAVLFVVDIIIRQLRWQDVKSFFSGIFRRRSK